VSAFSRTPIIFQAVALSLTGLLLLDVMGAIIKHLGTAYPPQQLVMYRNLFGLVPCLAVLAWSREWRSQGRPILVRKWPLALSRGLFVTVAQFCFYTSLVHLEFATASTLAFASPLIVTALSVPILGDRVGLWRWSAVCVGFIGVLIVMRPGSEVFSPYALLPVLAALGYALSTVTIRCFDASTPTAILNVYGQLAAFVSALVLTLATSGYVPITSAQDWGWIVTLGVTGGAGILSLVGAYRLTRPSNLAPFDFFALIFAFVIGWLIFDEAPLERLFPGVLLIVGAGLLIVWRERVTSGQDAN
jgi:drug/metabolite transporter (DMT)-like permease